MSRVPKIEAVEDDHPSEGGRSQSTDDSSAEDGAMETEDQTPQPKQESDSSAASESPKSKRPRRDRKANQESNSKPLPAKGKAAKKDPAEPKRKNPPRSKSSVEPSSSSGPALKKRRMSERGARMATKRASSSVTSLEVPKAAGKTQTLAAGDNEVGQLGSERTQSSRFAPIADLQERVVSCAAGGMHSLVLTEKGHVFSFGCNDDGSLGRETEEEEECFKPAPVVIEDVQIAKIAAGNIHSVALSTDCRVFIWGSYRDNSGPFGIAPDNSTFILEPAQLSVPDLIVDITCGADHTLMLSAAGTIYTMGCAEHGRLGRIRRSHCCRENRRARQVMLTPNPLRVRHQRKMLHFDGIWAGRFSSFARSVSDGSIWGFGLNNCHQLGKVDPADQDDGFVFHPVELRAFDPQKKWTQICGGEQHTLALDSDGTVYSMGRALYGRLGLGPAKPEDPDVPVLTPVPGLEKRVVAIAAGDHCSFALDKDGQLWCWGQGTNMLGQGDRDSSTEQDIFVPTQCTSKHIKNKKVLHVAAGSNHALCVVHE